MDNRLMAENNLMTRESNKLSYQSRDIQAESNAINQESNKLNAESRDIQRQSNLINHQSNELMTESRDLHRQTHKLTDEIIKLNKEIRMLNEQSTQAAQANQAAAAKTSLSTRVNVEVRFCPNAGVVYLLMSISCCYLLRHLAWAPVSVPRKTSSLSIATQEPSFLLP